jgi:hypothetical protein
MLNHRGIGLFPTPRSEHHKGMPRLADWFLGRPNHKEDIDLPYLPSNYSSSAQGQMCGKLHQKAAIIAVSIAGVRIISSGIIHSLRNLTKGKVLIKVIRTRVKGR